MNKERSGLLLLILSTGFLFVRADDSHVMYYKNEWLAHVPYGEMVAKELAHRHDMEYIGPEPHITGYYRMTKTELPPKLPNHYEDITNKLNNHELITTVSQEAVKERSNRNLISSSGEEAKEFEKENNYMNLFNDEFWPEMWYLHRYRKRKNQPARDMNVILVHRSLKFTGKNVNITVPDDGLEWTHPEIIQRFSPTLSWNYISNNNKIEPDVDMFGNIKSHGTKCAGEIIMQPNNHKCGVGVAYDANIGGVKILDDTVTDAREAKALNHAIQFVDIYSNSWGPPDNGKYMEHLSDLTKMALSKGISQGRDGKGAIYVFPAGNGKRNDDNCACDSYVNSIYTIVVASCDEHGHATFYSERCAAILTTAFGGSGFDKNVLTTTVNGKCTNAHSGTSAAAPLVSGIIALGLSANPELSWRDVQHLIAWTSQVAPLSNNYGWNKNAAGFYYSVDFGFGLMDGYQFVKEAMHWKNVPEMSSCGIRMPSVKGFYLSRTKAARIIVSSDGCYGLSGEINYLEYVQLVILMSYTKRGDIQIAMRSPSGTECHVFESRNKDTNTDGLLRWTFTIASFWGETPKGKFVIDIYDKTGPMSNKGIISEMTLSLHGTKDQPEAYKNGPRLYDNFKLPKQGTSFRFNFNEANNDDKFEFSDHKTSGEVQDDDETKRYTETTNGFPNYITNKIMKFATENMFF